MPRFACFVAFAALAGCVPQQQSPPPEYGAAPQPQPAAAQQQGGLGCMQLFSCFSSCNADGPCIQGCLGQADPAAQAAASAFMQCGGARCQNQDGDCLATQCRAEADACRATGGATVAQASPEPSYAAPEPAPASSAAVHVSDVVKAYENNELRAQQQYGGQRMRVYGTINSIIVQDDGRISVTFKGSAGTYGNARCYFDSSQGSRVATLNAHQEATMDGTVRGWEPGYSNAKVFVMLDGCTVP